MEQRTAAGRLNKKSRPSCCERKIEKKRVVGLLQCGSPTNITQSPRKSASRSDGRWLLICCRVHEEPRQGQKLGSGNEDDVILVTPHETNEVSAVWGMRTMRVYKRVGDTQLLYVHIFYRSFCL